MTGIILEYLTSFLDSVICIWFITKFINAKKNMLISLPAVLIYFAATALCDKYLSNFFSVLGTSILFVLSVIYAVLICEKHYIKAVLSCVIYKTVFILISSALFSILSYYFQDFTILLQGSDSSVRFVYISMHKIILFAILTLIIVLFKNGSVTDIVTGIVTFSVSVLTVFGMKATMNMIASGMNKTEPAACYTLLGVFILINICVYLLVNRVKKLEKQKYDLELLQDHYEYQQEKHAESISIWNNIRKVQHDIKNHLIAIKSELDEGRTDEAIRYVDSLIPQTDNLGKLMKSDNNVLDYLINSKLCTLENTQVIVSGVVGDLSGISDKDIVSIFGNILDNAVEAIKNINKQNEKRIELLFNRHEDNMIVICKNTIEKSVLNGNGELRSTKSDNSSHGFGHVIVEETIKKLGGMINYSEDGDMFTVQIILPMRI
ncbi:MAG: GHKL domain-containing protein [Clostridia bacterium]|nr:GHKL domain-containing protein [Clostridia bacterium]